MTTISPDPRPLSSKADEIRSPQGAKEVHASQQRRRQKAAAVSWYGSLLMVSTLLVAAGWQLFRWIVAIITLD